MLTEAQILARHRDDLKIARECCEALKMNAVEAQPRGRDYARLGHANRRLEGSCRQMFHWRGDDPGWLRLGAIYARAGKVAATLYLAHSWAQFRDLGQLYALGERRLAERAERPTGRSLGKLILPGDISPWFERAPRLLQ